MLMMVMTCLAAGCSRRVAEVDNPVTVGADLYSLTFDAATDVLRDNGYVIDYRDYRFGRIATRPQGSPHILEVWNGQNTTAGQALESTLADEQRRVVVTFTETKGSDPVSAGAPGSSGSDEPADAGASGPYALKVEVILERKQIPTRRMIGSARRNVFSNLSAVPKELADKGVTSSYWEPIGRDAYLEARLMRQITQRMRRVAAAE